MNFKLVLILLIAFVLLVDSATPNKRKDNKSKNKKNGSKDTKTKSPKADEQIENGNQTTQAGGCKDEGTNCKAYIGQCNDKAYEELLKKHCNLSCGHCPPEKGSACVDLSTRCNEMKTQGFCGSKKHAVNEQRIYCVKTCDLCEK